MNQNNYVRRKKNDYGYLIPGIIFLVITIFFCHSVSSVSSATDEKEVENIENAVVQSALFCYGTEGAYPESLDYLQEHYGLTYDEKKYVVQYEIIAKNIPPQVRVIRKKRESR